MTMYSGSNRRYTAREGSVEFVVSGQRSGKPHDRADTGSESTKIEKRTWAKTVGYILFVSLFGVEMVISASHPDALLALQPWQWLVFGIAAFRGARALSYNGVFAWLRQPFTEVVPDSSGAGDSVVPRRGAQGLLYVIGDCLACPICTGTHTAGVLMTLTALAPTFGLFLVYGLALAGVAELLHWHSERDEWQGRAAREAAGTEWMQKNRPQHGEIPISMLTAISRAERRSCVDRRRTPAEMPSTLASWRTDED